jgi:tetratricopeptide (TPR) repeat protein
VFIATPGGLSGERSAFKETLTEYNDSDAIERGVLFLAVGWELTLPGIGRPQALINQDLEKCDYLVLILWDRWGSPTDDGKNPKYSSGVEEEFNLAGECFEDPAKPMRQLVVFFKSVEARQLTDPGSQLQKVLDFKARMEAEKKLLYDTFDDIANFKLKLRRSLAFWLRDHECGRTSKVTHPEPLPIPSPSVIGDPPIGESGESTVNIDPVKPERELAEGAVRGRPEDLIRFGRSLMAGQRYSEAAANFEKALQLNLPPEDRAKVLAWMAQISMEAGDFRKAEELYRESVKKLEGLPGADGQMAGVLNRLASAYQAMAKYVDARECLEKALALREGQEPQNQAGIAYANYNLASFCYAQSRYRESKPFAVKALEIRRSYLSRFQQVVATSMILLGSIQRALGEYSEAEDLLTGALAMFREKDKEHEESALVPLGILRKDQGRFDEAKDILQQGLAIRERQSPEQPIVANVLLELGDCYRLIRDFKRSELALQRALSILEKRFGPKHPRAASALLELARLYSDQQGHAQAEALLKQALGVFVTSIGLGVPRTARCQLELGRVFIRIDKRIEGEELIKEAIGVFERQLGLSHPETLRALNLYATLLRETGRTEEARAVEPRASHQESSGS